MVRAKAAVRQEVIKQLADLEYEDEVTQSYIACLSKRGDDLSQWRAYGQPRGYSIGFDNKTLRRICSLEFDQPSYRVVEYDKKIQDGTALPTLARTAAAAAVSGGGPLVTASAGLPRRHPARERESVGPVLFAYGGSLLAIAAIAEAGRQLPAGRDALVLTVWRTFNVGFSPNPGPSSTRRVPARSGRPPSRRRRTGRCWPRRPGSGRSP